MVHRVRWIGLVMVGCAAACASGTVPPPGRAVETAPVETASATPAERGQELGVLSDELAAEEPARARRAADELARLGTMAARDVLLTALGDAKADKREILFDALSVGYGGVGLVAALERIDPTDPDRAFASTSAVFAALEELTDPRAADALARYARSASRPVWRTRAALCLSQLGDLRAVPILAERLGKSPVDLYGDSPILEESRLARDDSERVVAVRLLADLATLHAGQRETIWAQAEDAVLAWLDDMPQPHANGMRFLAIAGVTKALPRMRAWAFPKAPLPAPGQQPPFPAEFAVAQSGLRYLGWMRDEPSWGAFEKQLGRRKTEARDMDASMPALMGGGIAMAGMAVRALGVGVAQGYAQWGDTRAYPILIKVIENPRENEQVRLEACHALGWVTPDDKRTQAADRVAKLARSANEADLFTATCYAESLARRPFPEVLPRILPLIDAAIPAALRATLARAVGRAGLDDAQSATLLSKLDDPAVRGDAMVALALGAPPSIAAQAMRRYQQVEPAWKPQLEELSPRVHAFFSEEDLERGRLERWAENAAAIASVTADGAPTEWARQALRGYARTTGYDQGPRSVTRTVWRYRLLQDARSGDPARARRTLAELGETGAVMALDELAAAVASPP